MSQWGIDKRTAEVGRRGVLICRLDLLGEQRPGEHPDIELQREDLRVRIAELGVEAAPEARLPYGEEA